MSDEKTKELEELLEHNSRMLKDAEAGNWDQVSERERIRQQLIKTFYSKQPLPHQAAMVASATLELQRVNERLTKLAMEARDKVTTELSEMGKNKAAISAYNKHSR